MTVPRHFAGNGWHCAVFARSGPGRSLDDPTVVRHLGERAAADPTARGWYEPDGRPRFPGLQVSISHDVGLLCVATSTTGAVGVDLCGPVDVSVADRLSRRWFPAHAHAWAALPAWQRCVRWQRLWASTEAVAKAAGIPLLRGIVRIEIGAASARVAGVADAHWQLDHRRLAAGHVVVALRSPRPSLAGDSLSGPVSRAPARRPVRALERAGDRRRPGPRA